MLAIGDWFGSNGVEAGIQCWYCSPLPVPKFLGGEVTAVSAQPGLGAFISERLHVSLCRLSTERGYHIGL